MSNTNDELKRKLTIKKVDYFADIREILKNRGIGIDQILKNQSKFKLGTEYNGILEQDEPSKPSPLFRQSSLYPTNT